MPNGAHRFHQTLNANSSSEIILIPLLGKVEREVHQEHEFGDVWGEGGWFTRYSSIIRRFSVIPIQDLTAPGAWTKSERGLNAFSWAEGCLRLHFVVNEGGSGSNGSAYGNSVWSELQAHRHVYGAIGLVHAPSIGENTHLEDLDRELNSYTDLYEHVMVKRVFVFDHNFEAGSIPGFNASQHVVLPPAPEGLEPLQEATIMERFLAEPLYDVAVNLIHGYDTIIKYCSLVFSPSPSRPPVKGIAKSMLPSLCTSLDKITIGNDSGGGVGFFENVNVKRDKHCMSRLRKYMGDISLLAGSPEDAMYFYDSALLELKTDHVWLASALEGSAAAFCSIKDSDHPITVSPELSSFISKVVTSSSSSGPGSTYSGTAEVGSEKGALIRGSLDMFSRIVVERCSSSLKCMSEKKELRMLELELWFKLARFHLSNGTVDAAIDCVLRAQDIHLSNPRYEVERAMEAAVLCHEMGLRRKAAFFVHIASTHCKAFNDWDTCHALARTSAKAYGIEILAIDEASCGSSLLISKSSVGNESNMVNPKVNLRTTKNDEKHHLGKGSSTISAQTNGNGYSYDLNQENSISEEKKAKFDETRNVSKEVGEQEKGKENDKGGKSLPLWPLDPRKFSRGHKLWIALQKNLLQDLLTVNTHCGGNSSRLQSLQYYSSLLRIVAVIESARQTYDVKSQKNHSILSHDASGIRNAGIVDAELLSVGSSDFKLSSPSMPDRYFSLSASRGSDKEEHHRTMSYEPSTAEPSVTMSEREPGSPFYTRRRKGGSVGGKSIKLLSNIPPSPSESTVGSIRHRVNFAHMLGRRRESSSHGKDITLSEDGGESAVVAHKAPVLVEEQVELVNGMTQCAIQLSPSFPHTHHYPPSYSLSTSVYHCPLYPSLNVPDVPYLESAHPIQLPPNMEPVMGSIGNTEGKLYNTAAANNKDQAATHATVNDPEVGGFYFNPYEIGKAKGRTGKGDSKGDGKQQPRRWVVDEMCFIHTVFSNPLSVAVEATKVEAAVQGADAHVYATSFILPPHSKSVPIQLSVKPKKPGNLTLSGVYMTVFGLPILCPIQSRREDRSIHSVVTPIWEYPWSPEEETVKLLPQSRKCSDREGCCATDENIIRDIVLCPPMPRLVPLDGNHSDMKITVHPGETRQHVIKIINRSDSPVGALELWIETKSGNSLLFSSENQNQNEDTTTARTMMDEDLSQRNMVVQQQQQSMTSIITCDAKNLSHQLKVSSSLTGGGELHIPLVIQAPLHGKVDNNNNAVEGSIRDTTLTVIYSSGHETSFTRHMKLPLIMRVVPGLRFLGVRVGFPWHDSLVVSEGKSILNVNDVKIDETDDPDVLVVLQVANDSTLPAWVCSKARGVTAQIPPSGSMILPGSTQSLVMSIKRRWVEAASNESSSSIMKERIIVENDEVRKQHHSRSPMKTDVAAVRCWKEQQLFNILSDLLTMEWFMTLDPSDTDKVRAVHNGCLSFPLRHVAEEKGIPIPFSVYIQSKRQHRAAAAALPNITVPNYLRTLILPPLRLTVLPHRLSTTSTHMSSSLNNSPFPVFDAEKYLLNSTALTADNEAMCASTWNICVDLNVSIPVTVVAQNLTSADTIRLTPLQLSAKVRDDTSWVDIEDKQDEGLPIKMVWSGILDAYRDVPPKGWVTFGAVAKFMASGEYVLSARAEWQTVEDIKHSDTNNSVTAAAAAYKMNDTRSTLSHAPLLVKVLTKTETIIECQETISDRLLHGKIVTQGQPFSL